MTNRDIAEALQRIEAKIDAHSVQFLPLAEAAKYLGIAKSTLYKLTSKGAIPYHKAGGKLVSFSKGDLDRYLSGNRIRSRSEIAAEAGQ